MLNLADDILYLVNCTTIIVSPSAPLFAIDGSEFTIFVSPFIPNPHTMLLQVADIGIALQEPQQLVDNTFEVQFFGSKQREAVFQIETHLVAENGNGSGACPIVFDTSVV
jgi:hypothetical protein